MNSIPFKEQQYHPIRWMGKMSGYLADSIKKTNPELSDFEFNQQLNSEFTQSLESVIKEANFPYSTLDSWEEYVDEIFDIVIDFYQWGQNVFHIQPELAEMLMKTDVNNIRVNEIKHPYDMFYLHFGNAGPSLWGDFHLDGTYIKELSTEFNEKVFGLLYIGSKTPNTYPEDSSPYVVFEDEIHLFTVIEHLETEIETIGENFKWHFKGDPVGSNLVEENYARWEPYMEQVNALVINSLFFLESRPDDVEENYTEKTPKSLVKKLDRAEERGDIKTKERTESKIESRGFKKVKFVGSQVAKTVRESKRGTSPRAHWRRGHWRRQPFGKDLTKKKLIWIEPTLVGADKKADVEIKHLYDVEN